MLLRFSVSNFSSLRDKQELSLVASKLKGDAKGLIEASELRNETVLPGAVIYGSNRQEKAILSKHLLGCAISFSTRIAKESQAHRLV
jgi:hypothetical protein